MFTPHGVPEAVPFPTPFCLNGTIRPDCRSATDEPVMPFLKMRNCREALYPIQERSP